MLDLAAKYQVITFAIGDTKAGTKMGKLQLKKVDDEAILNCILWEEALGRLDHKIFRSGNILRLLSATYNEKFNNCLVANLELLEEAKLGLSDEQINENYSKILSYANKIENENLKTYVTELLFENEDSFKITPAAKLMHHNYLGGLLQHTMECLEIADNLLTMFPNKINRSDIYAACILHDFGKIFEYEIDKETGLIEYNETFRKEWLTHSQWGFSNCMAKGFNDVAKMIAAHHSRQDWGAIIDLGERDLDASLYLLHHIDDLSAKYGKINVKDI